MRASTIFCVAAAAIVALALLLPAPATSGKQKAYVLTALADIGTVYWRYDCRLHHPVRWAIGIRIFYTATTKATFRAGKLTLRRTLQPKQVSWFPFRRDRVQRLAVVQATEPGTLRGYLTVDWGRGATHCAAYMPPRFTVQLYPR